jgi:PTS system galactitol-specific IIC component
MIVQKILGVGATALLPIMITLLGLYFRMPFFRALKNGLLIGIGFLGLNLVLGLLRATLVPITEYYKASGSGFHILDLGWQDLAASAWASPFAAIVVPAGLVLNFVLIRIKVTKTLNVDIWNYWHFLMSASIAYYLLALAGLGTAAAGSLGFLLAMALVITDLKLADKIAPRWQKYFGLEGTTCSTFLHISTIWPVAWLGTKIVRAIPGIRDADVSLSWVNKRLGAFGDTAILSFFIGMLLAAITFQPFDVWLKTGVGVSAAIILLPRMVALLMEGLTPVSRAAKAKMHESLGEDQDIHVGMDCALGTGDPTAITAALIMIPITIGLAFVIPGNQFFPIGMMGSLAYMTAICSMETEGNLLHTILVCSLYMIFTMVSLNFLADLGTAFIGTSGTVDLKGAKAVGSSLHNIPDIILGILGKIFGLI